MKDKRKKTKLDEIRAEVRKKLPPATDGRNLAFTSPKEALQHSISVFEQLVQKKGEKGKGQGYSFQVMRAIAEDMRWLIVNVKHTVTGEFGPVPGIDVGDTYEWRAAMRLVGLHRKLEAGIDWMEVTRADSNTELLAVSVVTTVGKYEDDNDLGNTLDYTGEGGQDRSIAPGKQIKDQELKGGNLALYNSKIRGNVIRVIRGRRDDTSKTGRRYSYDGLYKVVSHRVEQGKAGFKIYKFTLEREVDQAPLTWSSVDQHPPKQLKWNAKPLKKTTPVQKPMNSSKASQEEAGPSKMRGAQEEAGPSNMRGAQEEAGPSKMRGAQEEAGPSKMKRAQTPVSIETIVLSDDEGEPWNPPLDDARMEVKPDGAHGAGAFSEGGPEHTHAGARDELNGADEAAKFSEGGPELTEEPVEVEGNEADGADADSEENLGEDWNWEDCSTDGSLGDANSGLRGDADEEDDYQEGGEEREEQEQGEEVDGGQRFYTEEVEGLGGGGEQGEEGVDRMALDEERQQLSGSEGEPVFPVYGEEFQGRFVDEEGFVTETPNETAAWNARQIPIVEDMEMSGVQDDDEDVDAQLEFVSSTPADRSSPEAVREESPNAASTELHSFFPESDLSHVTTAEELPAAEEVKRDDESREEDGARGEPEPELGKQEGSEKIQPEIGDVNERGPTSEGEYEVECILEKRTTVKKRKRLTEYFVLWKGWAVSDSTWEPAAHLTHCSEALDDFERVTEIDRLYK